MLSIERIATRVPSSACVVTFQAVSRDGDLFVVARGSSYQDAHLIASTRRIQLISGFQLALFWSNTPPFSD